MIPSADGLAMPAPPEPESVRAGSGIELRCPEPVRKYGQCRPGKLFAMLHVTGEVPHYVDNLIVMACLDCKRARRRDGEEVGRVLHRFDFAGRLVDTVVEPG